MTSAEGIEDGFEAGLEYDLLSPGSKRDEAWTWTNENENELDESVREDGVGIAFRIGIAWHGMVCCIISL